MPRSASVTTWALLTVAHGYDLSRTPAMGFNTWNNFGCGTGDTVLRQTAQVMVDKKLKDAGYIYVNSDDCWLLAARDANGNIQPDPSKFPASTGGINGTIAFIHSLGMKAGLYTARGHNTCAGYAGACGHEAQDAAWYAAHLIDYLKDDDCGGCSEYLDDYGAMFRGLVAAGRPILLSVEGQPDVRVITKGGYGNSKRVGHDITSSWTSMTSLVDIGSGIWPYAHNSTDPAYGGWFSDLDMLEVGRGEFSGPGSLDIARAHFSLWCIMKSPLLLGNDLRSMTDETLGVINETHAIAVNQDALGIQGRRTSVHMPKNTSIVPSDTGRDAVAVIAPCDASSPSQRWTYINASQPAARTLLYLAACDATDVYQQWSYSPGGALRNIGSNLCADASGQNDPSKLEPCNAASDSQKWTLDASSAHFSPAAPAGQCFDVFNFQGPDVEIYSCKTPGDNDDNQRWRWDAANSRVQSLDTQTANGWTCLSASAGPSGSQWATGASPAGGPQWCLEKRGGDEGSTTVGPCDANNRNQKFTVTPASGGGYQLGFGYNNGMFASGPWPHTRYVTDGGPTWNVNISAATAPGGWSLIQASDRVGILDDNSVGLVTQGGDFCLDVRSWGMLEVWTVPLVNGAYAAVLFNRSPSADAITLSWSDLDAWGTGIAPTAAFAVYDVWAYANKGTFRGSYTASAVPAHGVAMLILTPSA